MSLYAITTEMLSLIDAFDRFGAESPEAAEAIREHADAIAQAFDAKADDYAALIRVCETRAAARAAEADRMRRLAQSDEALAERLRKAIMDAMTATNRLKVETARFKLAVRANGGKLPLVIADESALPAAYRVPVVSERIDKDAIRADLEAGKPVEGASFGVRGSRLDLR